MHRFQSLSGEVDNFSSLLNYGGGFDFFYMFITTIIIIFIMKLLPHNITELIDSRIQAFPVLYHSLWLLRCVILYIALTMGLQ
jgi:hypothetical protein